MKDDLDSAAWYRKRAEELRAIAEGTKDKGTKKGLLGIAGDYERLAESRERIDRTERDAIKQTRGNG